MSLNRIMQAFPHEEYAVSRANSTLVKGRRVDGVATTFTVVGHAQPADPAELQPLPEGVHTVDLRRLFTEDEVQTKDVVTIDGAEFEIWKVAHWPHPDGGQHYEAFCSRRVRQ